TSRRGSSPYVLMPAYVAPATKPAGVVTLPPSIHSMAGSGVGVEVMGDLRSSEGSGCQAALWRRRLLRPRGPARPAPGGPRGVVCINRFPIERARGRAGLEYRGRHSLDIRRWRLGRSGVCHADLRAAPLQWARIARWSPGVADPTAMLDEIHVEGIDLTPMER